MRFVRYEAGRHGEFAAGIAALEERATYPLGADSFKIGHGADYFAFFRRLGELHYYFVLDGDRVVAVGAGVLRSVPVRTWYLCDLKVHPDYRGRHLPLRLLSRVFIPRYLQCRRGYAISMNPADGRPNPIVKLMTHFRWLSSSLATTLELFSLDFEQCRARRELLERHRGPVSFLSLAGKKDIILASTGRPMPLLHMQFGPCAERGFEAPVAGHVHMLCAPAGDALAVALRESGLRPSATASTLHHGMSSIDWRFVLTSDI